MRVPNSERREIREKFPLPKVRETRPAQLDPRVKLETSAAPKVAYKQLTKVQTLLLDSLAYLTAILEAHHKGVILDHQEVIQAVNLGMHLTWTFTSLATPTHTYYTSGERVI